MKISIDLIKSFPNLRTFYFIDLMMFNIELPTFMRFCLLQGCIRQVHFFHVWKSHAQNGRSDSTPRILTFTFCLISFPFFVLFLGPVSLFLSKCFLDVNKIRKAAYSILEAVVWHKVVLFWNWKKACCLCAAQSTELAKVYCIATEFRLKVKLVKVKSN